MKQGEIKSIQLLRKADSYREDDLRTIMFDKDGTDFVGLDCCPVCGDTKCEKYMKLYGFQYILCLGCDSVFIDPRPSRGKLGWWYSEAKSMGRVRFENLNEKRQKQ